MSEITVSTKSELESARSAGVAEIVVLGELADQLKRGKKIALAGTAAIAALGVALAAIPFTGGLSAALAAPVAAMSGFEIAAIIAAAAVGITLLVAIFKDYEEISYDKGKMTLRRRQE